jgi:hypothetical protein
VADRAALVRSTAAARQKRSPVPRPGQHTRELLTELRLGVAEVHDLPSRRIASSDAERATGRPLLTLRKCQVETIWPPTRALGERSSLRAVGDQLVDVRRRVLRLVRHGDGPVWPARTTEKVAGA